MVKMARNGAPAKPIFPVTTQAHLRSVLQLMEQFDCHFIKVADLEIHRSTKPDPTWKISDQDKDRIKSEEAMIAHEADIFGPSKQDLDTLIENDPSFELYSKGLLTNPTGE
jgi:hypothetical protein